MGVRGIQLSASRIIKHVPPIFFGTGCLRPIPGFRSEGYGPALPLEPYHDACAFFRRGVPTLDPRLRVRGIQLSASTGASSSNMCPPFFSARGACAQSPTSGPRVTARRSHSSHIMTHVHFFGAGCLHSIPDFGSEGYSSALPLEPHHQTCAPHLFRRGVPAPDPRLRVREIRLGAPTRGASSSMRPLFFGTGCLHPIPDFGFEGCGSALPLEPVK